MALQPLSTTVSAQSDAFVRGIDKCRGSLRNLVASLDPVAAATNRYNKDVARLDAGLKQGTISADLHAAALTRLKGRLDEVTRSQNQTGASSGAMRSGLQNVGFQVQDFAVQVVGGTDALRAFSMQAPQLIGALQSMSGGADGAKTKFGAFAALMGGPWGVAIGTAIPIMALVVQGLFGMGDEADKSKAKIDRLRESIEKLEKTGGRPDMEALGRVKVQAAADRGAADMLAKQIARAQEVAKALTGAPGVAPEAGLAATRRVLALQEAQKALVKSAEEGEGRVRGIELQVAARAKLDAAAEKSKADEKSAREAARDADKSATAAKRDLNKELKEEAKSLDDTRRALADLANDTRVRLVEQGVGVLPVEMGRKKEDFLGGKDDRIDAMADRVLGARENAQAKMEQFRQYQLKWAKENEQALKSLNAAWLDSAQTVVDSLAYMTSAIKSGGFLDILSAAISAFRQLGSVGLFGSKVQQGLAGARANGGPVSGGASYLVGERGPEIFTPDRSGYIVPNNDIGGRAAGARVEVVPSAYFDAVVDQRAQAVATPIGLRAASAGSTMAQRDLARSRKNRIPGR